MSQETLFEGADGSPDFERLAAYEAWFTPGPVVLQGLQWLRRNLVRDCKRFLDPCAGAGVFAQQARRCWDADKFVSVEARNEEETYLERHSKPYMMTFQEFFADRRRGSFDVIAGNPPFSLFPQLQEHAIDFLRPDGALMLLAPTQSLQRGEEKVSWLREHPPSIELKISGSIGFRGPGINPKTGKPWGVDALCYSWWIWRFQHKRVRTDDTPKWITYQLDWLPSADRRWTVRPGTEEEAA